jgi:hypothetical protein
VPDFTDVAPGGPRRYTDVQQIIDTWKGNSGKGVPLRQIAVQDSGFYAGWFRNLDPANGLVLLASAPSGVALLDATKNGVRFSPDGVLQGLVPASRTGVETLTSKTLQDAILNHNRFVWGSGITPAASTAIPTDGNAFVVTGAATVTAMTGGLVGLPIILKFATAGCIVRSNATLQLRGDFSSLVNSVLVLFVDASGNYVELARNGSALQEARVPIAGQTLVDNASDAVVTLAGSASYDPYTYKSGNTLVCPINGIYSVWGNIIRATPGGGPGNYQVTLYKGGSAYEIVFSTTGASGKDAGGAWRARNRFNAGDALDVRAAIAGAGFNISLRTASYFGLTFEGP